MGKRRAAAEHESLPPNLFIKPAGRRRSGLVLARFLAEEAESMHYRGPQQEAAHKILVHWADLEREGHLARKETSLDANFMHDVFGQALHYLTVTESPDDYQQERNFTVPGIGTADGALGNFSPNRCRSPLAVIELKGAAVNLDRDRFNGRTPVQQCWDYLNALPDCPWGIVSNFVTFRLYHREKTPLAYEEFRLQDLRDLSKFRQFYCLFERGGLVRPRNGFELRALKLLEKTEQRQRTVGDELYEMYSDHRARLIEHLHGKHKKSLDMAIFIAQRILDRIIFIAFCEDRELLPARCIDLAYNTLPPFTKVTNPRWRNFVDLFEAVDKGHGRLQGLDNGYNGGLFARNAEVDDLQLEDDWTHFFRTISTFDFRDEVNVDVLGISSRNRLPSWRRCGYGAFSVRAAPARPAPPCKSRPSGNGSASTIRPANSRNESSPRRSRNLPRSECARSSRPIASTRRSWPPRRHRLRWPPTGAIASNHCGS